MPVGLMPFQIIQPQEPTKWAIYLFIACPQPLFSGFSLSNIFLMEVKIMNCAKT